MVVVITSCSLRREWPINVCPDSEDDEETMVIKSDWWNTNNSEAFISGASTGNQDGTQYTLTSDDIVLLVFNEDSVFNVVAGSPGNRECQLDLGNGKILFGIMFDGSQRVQVLFKR